jgi:peptidoglycan/xylan/chitin deacetylase (PgdA/CDA1 family)
MYHQVLGGDPVPGSGDYFGVSLDTFRRHLDEIGAAGYRGCSLSEALAGGTDRRVAITFDDGTIGHFDHALPELSARGMTATFFVTTTWVGQPGYAGWDQLRAMQKAGMEIGSHTRTHPFLSELQPEALTSELAGSRAEIERQLGREVRCLALPGGDAPRRALRHLLGDAGYTAVATSRWGVNPDPPPRAAGWIRRATVRGAAPLTEFRRILDADAMLSLRHQAREAILGALRRALGPSRYARWRRHFLDAADGGGGPGSGRDAGGSLTQGGTSRSDESNRPYH